MTIRQRIVAHLAANPGQSFTNRMLAHALDTPEPSVRRATLKEISWSYGIRETGKTQGGAYLYGAPEPVATEGLPA